METLNLSSVCFLKILSIIAIIVFSNIILCYVIICKAPLTGSYSEHSVWHAYEKYSGPEEMQVISLGKSYSGLQEECHSRVRDQLQQKRGPGIKKYVIWEQEDQIDQQSEVVERSE